MVNDPAYETANAEKAVYLSAFNLVGSSTYAYVYDNLLTSPWVNVVPLTYPVPSTLGLALSTTTNASQFMNMTGRLITGSINTGNGPSVTNTGLTSFPIHIPVALIYLHSWDQIIMIIA